MSTTTKEPMPTPTMVNAGPDGSRRTDAVGAEIPVIVHASRYSAAKGVGKQLPTVHEETRTVIVFPQGAVVRLSASMTVGELVVLTNRQTGGDALCRVVNVKTQPGIQNYVNLEFTQRAPGFWGECVQSDRSELSAPPAVSPVASPVTFPSPASAEPMPAARDLRPAVALEPNLAAPAPAAQRLGTPVASSDSGPALESSPSLAALSRASQGQSWTRPAGDQARSESNSSSTRKMLLIGAAAAVLVGLGAVGGSMLLRQGRAAAPQLEAANNPDNPPQTAAPEAASQQEASPNSVSAEPAVASNASTPSEVTSPAADVAVRPARIDAPKAAPPAPAAQPAPVQESVPNVNVGKISAPMAKTSARAAASEAPPVLGAQASLVGSGLSGGLLGSAASGNPVAPPPVLAKGGQIQAPKLISSVSAIYPPQARSAHVQGDVVVEAIVDPTGKVTSVEAISGPLLLRQAALDAVRSWKYQPAQLDGKPVEVHTQVSLSFHIE